MENFIFNFKNFINENLTNDELIFLSCYGFLNACYHGLMVSYYLSPYIFPRHCGFFDSDSDTESEINEYSGESSEEEEYDDSTDKTYIQPSNYTSKLRKRKRKRKFI